MPVMARRSVCPERPSPTGAMSERVLGWRASVVVMKHELVERFRGRWVAVDEAGDVVADANELDALLGLVENEGLTADVVQRVPEADAPLFIGLD